MKGGEKIMHEPDKKRRREEIEKLTAPGRVLTPTEVDQLKDLQAAEAADKSSKDDQVQTDPPKSASQERREASLKAEKEETQETEAPEKDAGQILKPEVKTQTHSKK